MRKLPMHVSEGSAGAWRQWFAWHPVRTSEGTLVWLRRTWRRTFYAAPWFCINSWEEYSDQKRGFWDTQVTI